MKIAVKNYLSLQLEIIPKISKILLIFGIIFIFFPRQPVFGTTYDFSGISNPSATHIAYGNEIDVTSDPTVNNIPAAEITSGEYTALSISNNSYVNFPDPGGGDDCAIRCRFTVSETPANVKIIYAEWEGHQGATYPVRFLIWNYNSSAYELLQQANVGTSDVTLSGSIISNCSNYIDGSG
ncbi:hypothetical protein KAR10_09235, partial [bacterium]|nr:hypothetical protein [bacterium]